MSNFVNNDVSSGATIFASDHNTQGALIAAVLNGGIDNNNISPTAAIATSKLADDAGITTAKLADAVVTPAKLLAGTGASWAWQSWTPTLTNMSGGALTYAKYAQIGKTVFFRLKYTLAGAGIGGAVSFTLPVTANSDYASDLSIGAATYVDNGAQLYHGFITPSSSTVAKFFLNTVSGSNVIGTVNLSSTSPFTWGSGDYLQVQGYYEAA